LKFLRTDSPSVVLVASPDGRRHQLYDFECRLAREMNGERDLDELWRVARKIVPGVTRELLEKFVLQCAALGLLENLQLSPGVVAIGPPPQAPGPAPPTGSGVDFGTFKDQLLGELARPGGGLYDDTSATLVGAPSIELLEASADPTRTEPSLPPVIIEPILAASERPTLIGSAPSVGAPPPAAEPPPVVVSPPVVEAPPPVVPPPVVEAPSVVAPAPASEAPPEPHGEEWKHEKPPWHATTLFRRLRAWLVLAALVAAAAFIPWPLYVTEECVVLPVQRFEVRSVIDGLIAEIRVDEGSRVKKGDVLARLDDRDLQAQLKQARSDIDRLSANLAKMKHGARKEELARAAVVVSSRKHDLSFAQVEADRREKLFAQGVGSAEQRDTAVRDLELKRIALDQAKAEVRVLRAGFRPEEVAVAEAELQRAQSDEQYLEKKLTLLTVTSPIDGTIITPKFRDRLYEKVNAGSTVCEVADTRKVRVEIRVPERQIDVVALGQPTVVKVQSYPLHPFRGAVTFIGSAIEQKDDLRFLRVVTEIENSDGLLREDMTGYGEINTGKSTLLRLLVRRLVRWVRVRFLI
jgi:multidrug resistance efflux pump